MLKQKWTSTFLPGPILLEDYLYFWPNKVTEPNDWSFRGKYFAKMAKLSRRLISGMHNYTELCITVFVPNSIHSNVYLCF